MFITFKHGSLGAGPAGFLNGHQTPAIRVSLSQSPAWDPRHSCPDPGLWVQDISPWLTSCFGVMILTRLLLGKRTSSIGPKVLVLRSPLIGHLTLTIWLRLPQLVRMTSGLGWTCCNELPRGSLPLRTSSSSPQPSP